MKTFVLTVSRIFPKYHKRAGQQTWFVEKINEARMPISDEPIMGKKIHTIRANYELWKKRFQKIEAGEACLSLRFWSGKPYRSKQVEFLRLTREDGIGIQKITMRREELPDRILYGAQVLEEGDSWNPLLTGKNITRTPVDMYARNDGLTPEDFIAWFAPTFEKARKKYATWADLSTAMEMEFAVIHFTKYRY